MKNLIKQTFKIASIIILTIMASCDNPNSSTNNIPMDPILPSPEAVDDCCELKYPASQIGVEGSDLLGNFTRLGSSFNSPYKIKFTPTANFINVSQSYIDYVKALYPCATGIGSKIIISQGSLGGHTQRRMVEPRYVGFSAGGTTYTINASDAWDYYYSNPTPLPSSATYSTNNALLPNVIYGIEYGVWIEGCDSLTQKEKDCLGYFNYQKFRWQSPQNLIKGENYIILEILDEKNQVIKTKKIKTQSDKLNMKI